MNSMSAVPWEKISLFNELDAGGLERVKSIFMLESMESDEVVIREGDTGDDMFILVRGKVRVSKSMLVKSMEVPMAVFKNPSKVLATLAGVDCPIFGDMAMLDHEVRSATVTTLEPCTFLRTTRDRFYKFVRENPKQGTALLTALGRRLATTIRRNNSEILKLTTALALALNR